MSGEAGANGGFGKEGLLAKAVGDFGEFALVGADGREVFGLADEVKGAQSFPDLFVGGGDGGDFGACGYVRTRGRGEGADAAADRRTKFNRTQFVLRGFDGGINQDLCDEAALVDGSSNFI